MFDYPIPSNNSIIIFSATNAKEGVEGGRVRQNISFSAKTDISISGGVNNDFARIEPNGNTFTAVAKTNYAHGATTFNVSVTTAGNADKDLEGITVSFTFRVLVLGVDMPHLVQNFFEFKVGESVEQSLNVWFAAQQAQLNISKSLTMITSQTDGETTTETDEHGVTHTIWNGTPSGIYLKPQLDSQNYVRGASLTGIAERPGIYFYKFEISSYDNNGGIYAFPGANGYALLIINIYDDRESPKAAIPTRYISNQDFIRVIDHALGADYVYARLLGEFIKSGDMWIREVREQISDQVSDVWQYRMIRSDDGDWTLSGRNYLSDQTAPDYQTMSTVNRFGTTPPNNGWSNGVLCAGDGAKFVTGYGFFDLKGVYSADNFTSNVYEQQAIVSAQYKGWNNPPRLKYDDGLYLMQNDTGEWYIKEAVNADFESGTLVEPKIISNTAVPYMPATAGEKFSGNAYRDVSFMVNNIPINAHLYNETNTGYNNTAAIKIKQYPAAVLPHYCFLRQAVPPNNATDGYTIPFSYNREISNGWRYYIKSAQVTANEDKVEIDWSTGYKTKYSEGPVSDETCEKRIFSGSFPANIICRTNDYYITDLFGSSDGISITPVYEYNYDTKQRHETDTWYYEDNIHRHELYENYNNKKRVPDNANIIGNGVVHAVFASGRDQEDQYSTGYTAAAIDVNSDTIPYTEYETGHFYYLYWGEDTPAFDDKWEDRECGTGSADGFSISIYPSSATKAVIAKPVFGGYEIEIETSEYGTIPDSYPANARVESDYFSQTIYDPAPHAETTYKVTTFTATHQHTCYTGNVPPGLVDYGITHVVMTVEETGKETIHTDEWINDPRGEYFHTQIQDIYGQPIDDVDVSPGGANCRYVTREKTSAARWSTDIIKMRIG